MNYQKGNFYIDSDFEIRIVKEEEHDVDIFIPIKNRTLNLYLDKTADYLNSRMQFCMVKGIMIRFCAFHNNICTVHLLRNIDIQSSLVNFEIDYTNHFISLKDKEFFVEMRFMNK